VSKKKHITAPRSYDPGKGRPKEYLAYLNYQEMQALKRLNGNNQERGPKGLPSFPPDGIGGTYNSGYGSAAPKSTSSGSIGSKGGGASTQRAGAGGNSGVVSNSSLSSAKSTNTSNRNTSTNSATSGRGGSVTGAGGMFGGGSGNSGNTGNRSAASGRGGSVTGPGGMFGGSNTSGKPKGPGGSMAAAKDSAVRQAAANKNAKSAFSNPGFKADTGRSAIGGISKDKSKGIADGSKIKGAIKSVKETAEQARVRREGPIGPTPQQYKTPMAMETAMLRNLYNTKIAPTDRVSHIKNANQLGLFGKIAQGEAAFESQFGKAAVAKTIFNRIDAYNKDAERLGYMAGPDFNSLAAAYDVTGLRPETKNKVTGAYKAAVPGTPEYRQGIVALNQALSPVSSYSQKASPKVLNATHYYNPAAADPSWENKKSFETVGNHKFGNAEKITKSVTAARAEQDARVNPAGFRGDVATRIAEAGLPAPRPRARPESQNMQRPPSQYAGYGDFSTPDATRTALMSPQKEFNDRIPASVPSFSETPFGGPRIRSLATATPEERAALASAMRLGNPTSAPADYRGPKTATKVFNDRVPATPNLTVGRSAVTPTYMATPRLTVGRSAVTPTAPPRQQSEYSGYGATGTTTLPGIPKPDSLGITSEKFDVLSGPSPRTPDYDPLDSVTTPRTTRVSDAPPHAFAEKTYNPENLMSDAGIRKTVNPQPKPPAGAGMSFNGLNVPAAGMSFNGIPGTSVAAPPAGVASIPQGERAGGIFDTPVTTSQPGSDVLAAAPGAPKPGEKKETVYNFNPKLIDDKQAKVDLPKVLKDPDSIFKVAEDGRWSAKKNKEALAAVRDGIKDLKAAGAKFNKDGTISIPAGLEQKAQKVFNDLAKAYDVRSSMFKTEGVAKDFSEGLGKLANKDTVSKPVPVTKDQIAQYNKDVKSYLDTAQAAGKISRPVPSMNAFMPNITRQTPDAATGWGGPLSGIQAPKAPAAQPDTGWGGPLSGIKAPAKAPVAVNSFSPESRPYDVRLGEMKVNVPMRGPDGEATNGVSTIDNYVNAVPGLDSEQKSALRLSLIGDAARGNMDFTTEDMNQRIASIKNGETAVSDSAAADPAFANSLVGAEASEAAKAAGFPRNVFTNETFLDDPTQLGMLRESVTPDLTEMTKLHNRQRATIAAEKYNQNDIKPYLTRNETARAAVSNIVRNVFNINPLTRAGRMAIENVMNIEDPKTFLSRPAYEQRALYQYATAAAAQREGRPVPEAGYPQGIPGSATVPGGVPSGGGSLVGTGGGNREMIDGYGGGIGSYFGGGGSGGSGDGKSSSSDSGERPEIYYQWDLGVNIPSPGDPKYTDYIVYLAERQAAAEKMYSYG
jgi:hypothetical protein